MQKGWAICYPNSKLVSTETMAYGMGASIRVTRVLAIFPTRKEAKEVMEHWKNSDALDIRKVEFETLLGEGGEK